MKDEHVNCPILVRKVKTRGETNLLLIPVPLCLLPLLRAPAAATPPFLPLALQKLNPCSFISVLQKK
jgi:hypothetical protein